MTDNELMERIWNLCEDAGCSKQYAKELTDRIAELVAEKANLKHDIERLYRSSCELAQRIVELEKAIRISLSRYTGISELELAHRLSAQDYEAYEVMRDAIRKVKNDKGEQ